MAPRAGTGGLVGAARPCGRRRASWRAGAVAAAALLGALAGPPCRASLLQSCIGLLFGARPPSAYGLRPPPSTDTHGPAVARRQRAEHGGCPIQLPAADRTAIAKGDNLNAHVTDLILPGVKIDVLQAALSEGKPVVVDFMTPRCASCKRMDKVLDTLEDLFAERVRIIRVNVLQHQHFLEQLDFRRVPAVFLFEARSGQPVDSFIGSKARALDIFTSIEEKLLA